MIEWQWKRVMYRDRWTCQYCGSVADTVDHIIPRCYRGKDLDINLVAVCHPCNQVASGRRFDDFGHKKIWINNARATGHIPTKSSRDHRYYRYS